ncbi:MAG: hypothetical protein GX945_16310 [Lentisphaerae bacterium]|nr:hypothetical protein [Lentisphaerota bacterium]
MTATKKTIAAAAAAATLGVGTLVYRQWPSPAKDDAPLAAPVNVVDDVQPIQVALPSVTVPTITVDSLVTRVEPLSPPVVVYSPGKLAIQAPNTPAVTPVAVRSAIGAQPQTPAVMRVNPAAVDSAEPVPTPAPDTPKVAQVSIAPASVTSPAADIPRIQHLHKTLAAIVKDKRHLVSDKGISIHNPGMEKWLAIYEQPLPPPNEHIPLPQGIRMIAELHTPDHAAANLAYYRRQGYNACLISLDGSESVRKVAQLISLVRQADMAPWIAWAGPESLGWSIYQDPDKITRLLSSAAPLCQGYLVAWRRTSAHLVEQDAAYIEHLAAQVRAANPGIYIVGESYYGETWQNLPQVNQRGWTARDNAPRNPSGILITGIATQGYAIEIMLRSTFAKWVATPRLAQVLGERPYYASTNNTGRSFAANLRIKQQLERRFLRAGCVGTVTLHGDGSDRGSTLMTVDDIGKYKIE